MRGSGGDVMKLLPCPFCGTKHDPKLDFYVDTYTGTTPNGQPYWGVRCFGCGADMPSDTEEHAIKAWNARTDGVENNSGF